MVQSFQRVRPTSHHQTCILLHIALRPRILAPFVSAPGRSALIPFPIPPNCLVTGQGCRSSGLDYRPLNLATTRPAENSRSLAPHTLKQSCFHDCTWPLSTGQSPHVSSPRPSWSQARHRLEVTMSRCPRLSPVVSEQTQPACHDAPSSPAVPRLETSGLDPFLPRIFSSKTASPMPANGPQESQCLHISCMPCTAFSDSWLLIFFFAVFFPIDRQHHLVAVSSNPVLLLACLFDLLECRK